MPQQDRPGARFMPAAQSTPEKPTHSIGVTEWKQGLDNYRADRKASLTVILDALHKQTGTETAQAAAAEVAGTVLSIFSKGRDPVTEGKGRDPNARADLEGKFAASFSKHADNPGQAVATLGEAMIYLTDRVRGLPEIRRLNAQRHVQEGTALYADHLIAGAVRLAELDARLVRGAAQLIADHGEAVHKAVQQAFISGPDLRHMLTSGSPSVRAIMDPSSNTAPAPPAIVPQPATGFPARIARAFPAPLGK